MKRTYNMDHSSNIIGEKANVILTLNVPMSDIPFNVWRDMGRLAGKSYENLAGHIVFEFLNPSKVEDAIYLLRGAMWEIG